MLGQLIRDNFVSGGAATFRASLLPAICPIDPDAAYPDWWIATNIAAVAEITYDPVNANRYRYHGANMGLGADRPALLAIERRELPFRRWIMWHLIDDDTVTIHDVGATLVRWRAAVVHSGLSREGGVRQIIPVDPPAAAQALDAAAARPGGPPRCKGLLRALSRDPLDGAISADLETELMRATVEPGAAAALANVVAPPPLIVLETRPALTLAWLDDVLAQPQLLAAYAAQSAADEHATLTILAPAGADLEPLITLVGSDPLLNDERCDIQVLTEPGSTPARRLLAARACARLASGESPEPYRELPLHGAVERAVSATSALAA